MRDDLASPNLGSAPRDYNSTFFNRALKSVELTIARFLAKGPVQITDLTVDTVTATDVTVSDDLVVTDDATVGGDLAVTGTSNFVGATTASTIAATTVTADDVTVNDDLVVTDDASVGGDFSVTGTSTLGDVNASDGFFSSLNGPIGTVTPTTGNFTILAANETYSDIFVSTGDATIGGDVSCVDLTVSGTSSFPGGEGTWVPSLKFGGATTGIAGTQAGSYTKIGRLVFFSCAITLSSKGSATGAASIDGLPFAVTTPTATASIDFGFWSGMASVTENLMGRCGTPNSTSFEIRMITSSSATGTVTDANFTDTSILRLSGIYET